MSTERLFMIGVAAELAGMHPQTLRVYERRGLIAPRRTARNTRVYSEADVVLLRRIQELSEEGLNLVGIERVLRLEQRLERADRRIRDLRAELNVTIDDQRRQMAEARTARGQLVLAVREETALVPRYAPVVRRGQSGRMRGSGDGG
jgi:MerR family transcriptional regulator, heat shock protein HspR